MKTILAVACITASAAAPGQADGTFSVTSSDVTEGEELDHSFVLQGFGCDGDNISPALQWSDAPEGTESFVVTLYDPDAPTGSGWWHWVVIDIPPSVRGLPRGAGSPGGVLPDGATQSLTDFGTNGYGGACPPVGEVHRYQFSVHALSVPALGLEPSAMPALVGFMTQANVIETVTLTAVYSREK